MISKYENEEVLYELSKEKEEREYHKVKLSLSCTAISAFCSYLDQQCQEHQDAFISIRTGEDDVVYLKIVHKTEDSKEECLEDALLNLAEDLCNVFGVEYGNSNKSVFNSIFKKAGEIVKAEADKLMQMFKTGSELPKAPEYKSSRVRDVEREDDSCVEDVQ